MFRISSEGFLTLDFFFFFGMFDDASDLPWVFSFLIFFVGIWDEEAYVFNWLYDTLTPIPLWLCAIDPEAWIANLGSVCWASIFNTFLGVCSLLMNFGLDCWFFCRIISSGTLSTDCSGLTWPSLDTGYPRSLLSRGRSSLKTFRFYRLATFLGRLGVLSFYAEWDLANALLSLTIETLSFLFGTEINYEERFSWWDEPLLFRLTFYF